MANKSMQEKIEKWIEEGKKYIYPQRLDEWKKCVEIRANDLYEGDELQNALDIMKVLEEGGSLQEAHDVLYNFGHSGTSYFMTISILLSFAKKGPEFVQNEEPDYYKRNIEYIQKILSQNAKYEKDAKNSSENPQEKSKEDLVKERRAFLMENTMSKSEEERIKRLVEAAEGYIPEDLMEDWVVEVSKIKESPLYESTASLVLFVLQCIKDGNYEAAVEQLGFEPPYAVKSVEKLVRKFSKEADKVFGTKQPQPGDEE